MLNSVIQAKLSKDVRGKTFLWRKGSMAPFFSYWGHKCSTFCVDRKLINHYSMDSPPVFKSVFYANIFEFLSGGNDQIQGGRT